MIENKYKGLCNQLINELKDKGIEDVNVLNAISRVPRHLLFDLVFRDKFSYVFCSAFIHCIQLIN